MIDSVHYRSFSKANWAQRVKAQRDEDFEQINKGRSTMVGTMHSFRGQMETGSKTTEGCVFLPLLLNSPIQDRVLKKDNEEGLGKTGNSGTYSVQTSDCWDVAKLKNGQQGQSCITRRQTSHSFTRVRPLQLTRRS